ncbi:hypothetical protein [Modestobacter marinus]|uniref:hypothetical protein n=1 Tax=Modestobacter marinus TaxID=477641 RepID=UPI001C94669D|nr:hypothetical protein [Modestobacter marinus]
MPPRRRQGVAASQRDVDRLEHPADQASHGGHRRRRRSAVRGGGPAEQQFVAEHEQIMCATRGIGHAEGGELLGQAVVHECRVREECLAQLRRRLPSRVSSSRAGCRSRPSGSRPWTTAVKASAELGAAEVRQRRAARHVEVGQPVHDGAQQVEPGVDCSCRGVVVSIGSADVAVEGARGFAARLRRCSSSPVVDAELPGGQPGCDRFARCASRPSWTASRPSSPRCTQFP